MEYESSGENGNRLTLVKATPLAKLTTRTE
jgi:hypothetical protein